MLNYVEYDIKDIEIRAGKVNLITDNDYISLNFKNKDTFKRIQSSLIKLSDICIGASDE